MSGSKWRHRVGSIVVLVATVLGSWIAATSVASAVPAMLILKPDAQFARQLVPRYLGSASDVAVSPDGRDIWVTDSASNVVFRYDESLVPEIACGPLSGASGVAVETSGSVLVAARTDALVTRWSRDGVNLGTLSPGAHPGKIAVLPDGDIITTVDDYAVPLKRMSPNGTVVQEWTRQQVGRPGGVGADAAGNVWLADYYDHLVNKLGHDGSVSTWTSFSGGPAFSQPVDVAVVGDRVYVADRGLGCVVVGSADGEYLFSFGQSGVRPDQFGTLTGIGSGPDGRIYVADGRVKIYSADGTFLDWFGTESGGPAFWDWPGGLSLDHSTGTLWTNGFTFGSSGTTLQGFTSEGLHVDYEQLASNWGNVFPSGLAAGGGYTCVTDKSWDLTSNILRRFVGYGEGVSFQQQVPTPSYGMCMDDGGYLFAATQACDVLKYDISGSVVATFGAPGTSDGQLASPAAWMGCTNDGGLVTIETSGRVQRFDGSGAALGGWTATHSNGTALPVAAAAVRDDGSVLLLDSGNKRIFAFDAAGTLVAVSTASYPSLTAIQADDNAVYAVDSDLKTLRKFDTSIIDSDTAPPVVTIDAAPSYLGTADVSIASTDSGSGVQDLVYSLDGGAPVDGPSTITLRVAAPGEHSLCATATDFLGNVATAAATFVIIEPDTTPPTTEISELPTNWVNHDLSFCLTASDTDSPDGIHTSYGLNAPASQPYSVPVTISAEGTTTIRYRSADASGNVEATKTATVRIDKSDPSTADDHAPSYEARATVHLHAVDAVSGIFSTTWTLDGAPGLGDLVTTGLVGIHTLTYRSTDLAGNAETSHTVTFIVARPLYSTKITLIGSASAKVRKSYRLSGSIAPASAGGTVRVVLTRSIGGKWRSAGSKTLTLSKGMFSWPFTPRYKGSWRASVSYAGQTTEACVYRAAATVTKSFKVK